MDIYKTRPYIRESIPISEENLDRSFHKKKPYFEKGKNGKDYYYAVCPLCDNPIQIIGLYKTQENTKEPFGKHHKGTIVGIAEYDEEAYWNCPLHNGNYSKPKKRLSSNQTSPALLNYLLKNYDLLIDKLSNNIGIKISEDFAISLLDSYIANEGWRYYESTYSNIEYMLLYAEPATPLINRHIKKGTALHKALSQLPLITLTEIDEVYDKVEKRGNNFVMLQFRICNHKNTLQGGHKVETFSLKVNYEDVDVFKKDLVVDDGDDLSKYQHNRFLMKKIKK